MVCRVVGVVRRDAGGRSFVGTVCLGVLCSHVRAGGGGGKCRLCRHGGAALVGLFRIPLKNGYCKLARITFSELQI